jgi:membrane protease YdiL (CAAX protease family)
MFQQVLLHDGLVARVEALSRRTDVAAVLAALAFGVAHAPMNLPQAQGDHLLALSAALVFQAPIGLVFIVGYLRHRASVPLGVAHGFAIA